MGDLLQVTIDFDRSHLIFPRLIMVILLLLGVAIVIRDRKAIAHSARCGPRPSETWTRSAFSGPSG